MANSSPDQSLVYRFDEHRPLFDYLSGFDLVTVEELPAPVQGSAQSLSSGAGSV